MQATVYREELPGLRALAVLLVVCYHVWFGRVSGGVDVFLLISAFLLTGSFLRRIDAGGGLGVRAYWAKTFKRILPPAAVTVVATIALVWVWYPFDVRVDYLWQAGASLLYLENWYLAVTAVDYYAGHAGQSPFQHFWSLSIQGQVYLVWPLILLMIGLVSRKLGARPRVLAFGVFGAIFTCSLAYSVYLTATNQEWAYFDSFVRLWEFALGSLLAVVAPRLEARLSDAARLRVLMGWLGILGVVSLGAVMDVRGQFPGALALWPTVAACLVILAGRTRHRFGVDRLLVTRPLRWLGDSSYGLYLVHWPLLITMLALRGGDGVGFRAGLVLVAGSMLLGWLLTKLVDDPVRNWRWANAKPSRSALVVVVALTAGLAPLPVLDNDLRSQVQQAARYASRDNPGAVSLMPGWQPDPDADPDAPVLPLAPTQDWYEVGPSCRGPQAPSHPLVRRHCQMHQGDPDRVLVLVGNSRMQQTAPAIAGPAIEAGWTVMTLLKGGCHYELPDGEDDDCDEFNLAVTEFLIEEPIRAVVLQSTFLPTIASDGPTEWLLPGTKAAVSALTAAGKDVIGIRDIPRFSFSPTECEMDTPGNPECAVDVADMFADVSPDWELYDAVSGSGSVYLIDLTQWICPFEFCRPIVGNMWVFIDPNHTTASYAETMQYQLDQELRANGWSWRR